jgi:hypothetical protein
MKKNHSILICFAVLAVVATNVACKKLHQKKDEALTAKVDKL